MIKLENLAYFQTNICLFPVKFLIDNIERNFLDSKIFKNNNNKLLKLNYYN